MSETIYGLWHEGWCCFRTTRNPDHIGWGYSGTAEEAEVGRQMFIGEGNDPATYAVVTFDPGGLREIFARVTTSAASWGG